MTIFQKRLVFIVGKGGTGKTTLTAALSLAASMLGKKVLIVEVGEADAIGHLFDKGTLPIIPAQIHENIWGVRINSKAILEEYIHIHVGFNFIANRITRSKIFNHVSDATPGLKEVMTLGQIWRWEQGLTNDGSPYYDIIFIDAPATGHGFNLLRMPQALIDMLRVGPIVEQTRIVNDLLMDTNKTWLTVVTLPEELPVNETIEFWHAAQHDINMPVQLTFINGVYHHLFEDQENDYIVSMLNQSKKTDSPLAVLLDIARQHYIRQNLQQSYIHELNAKASHPLITIPFYYTNDIKVPDALTIANYLLTQLEANNG